MVSNNDARPQYKIKNLACFIPMMNSMHDQKPGIFTTNDEHCTLLKLGIFPAGEKQCT